jgi:Mg2+-importing ATPase
MSALAPSLFSFASLTLEELSEKFVVRTDVGLSKKDVEERQKKYGPNRVTKNANQSWRIFLHQLKSPFFLILLGAALFSFWLHENVDAILIFIFIFTNTLIGFLQERHAAHTLKLLEKYTKTQTTVLREGKEEVVEVTQLVPGDIVILLTGDILPADVRFISTDGLVVNESVVTGESAPVNKSSTPMSKKEKEECYECLGFAGTSVVDGKGVGVVVEIGAQSTIGQITELSNTTAHPNQLQEDLKKLSAFIFVMDGLTISALLAVHFFLRSQQNFAQLVLFFVALAVTVIPEALPVVMTFAFSRGARSLAKKKVIVKNLNAVEELGNIEVLCTDKTGTLTENTMRVVDVLNAGEDFSAIFALASSKSTYHKTLRQHIEPFDEALKMFVEHHIHRHQLTSFHLQDFEPFDPHLRLQKALIKRDAEEMIVLRGAPEFILAMCQNAKTKDHQRLHEWLINHGQKGNRTLAIAKKTLSQSTLTAHKNWQKDERGFTLVGLIAFEDPLRSTAKLAVKHAQQLGVKVKMLTGDGSEVAAYVAQEVGLIESMNQVINGADFAKLSEEQKREKVEIVHVFARINPEQKHEIIQLLQKLGHTVGFVGDGINDAPALRQAHVALTVSGASDIAREASDIILLHHSLSTIVYGIQEGRSIFANVSKYIKMTLASNFGNFYTIALSTLLLSNLPMLPLQILLINLLTDMPAIAIAGDRVDVDELHQPIRQSVKKILVIATLFGLISSFFDFIFFVFFSKMAPNVLQTNWFLFSIWTELAFLYSIRSRKNIFAAGLPSKALLALSILATAIAAAFPYIPFTKILFSLTTPTWHQMSMLLILMGWYVAANEGGKILYYKYLYPIIDRT